MSDKVKLIIEVSKEIYQEAIKSGYSHLYDEEVANAVADGTPLDSNDSDYAEAQAYFDGQAYGWEEGRKALIDDLKTKIETDLSWEMYDEYGNETGLHKELIDILDNIGKESEG